MITPLHRVCLDKLVTFRFGVMTISSLFLLVNIFIKPTCRNALMPKSSGSGRVPIAAKGDVSAKRTLPPDDLFEVGRRGCRRRSYQPMSIDRRTITRKVKIPISYLGQLDHLGELCILKASILIAFVNNQADQKPEHIGPLRWPTGSIHCFGCSDIHGAEEDSLDDDEDTEDDASPLEKQHLLHPSPGESLP
ncbi:hypothetical protein KC335_g169 [Hortaea werneckii]|nr:hypothetical protein KC335_g169 [Hortaea werneckii]